MEKVIYGVDLGGTFIKFGMFDYAGKLLKKWQVPTGDTGVEQVLKLIAYEINKQASEEHISIEQIAGIGMGIPGSVNSDGMLISAPNLGWNMLDMNEVMKKYLSVPVCIGNDANVAALGEQGFGAGEGCDSMVMITLGTGVGGGVVVNQHLVSGAFGGAGEIGHITVNPDETVSCNCGKKGCLEQYASATGIANMAKKMLVTALADGDEETTISSLQQFEMNTITAKEVFDAVKEGDTFAVGVAEKFGEILGRALSYVACTVDPERFVIGGGVSAAGERLLAYIEKYYRQYAFAPSREAQFKLAALGNDAGIYGAARLVMIGNVL